MGEQHALWRAAAALATGLAVAAVAGCGGSGGGGGGTSPPPTSPPPTQSAPPAPALSLEPQPVKTFHFTWSDVASETEYHLLENVDGGSGYAQIATIPADATSHDLEVFLPARVDASYILDACNAAGCTGSQAVFVGGAVEAAIGYLKASNTGLGNGVGDLFGFSAALSGDGSTLAVGAVGEDGAGVGHDQNDNSAADSGAVYVFVRDAAGGWSQQAYLKASNTDPGDRFGASLALSRDGSALAVGALLEDSAATEPGGDETDNTAADSGAVYVFTRSAGAWSQQAYLKASNGEAGDRFGDALALSGDGATLAVGTAGEDGADHTDNSAPNAGAVYVFTRSGGAWSQQAYLKASNVEEGDGFGTAVALSGDGDVLAVGASGEDSGATGVDGDQNDDTAASSGATYVFTRNTAGAWSQQAYLKASNADPGDLFGSSAALSDDGVVLAIGAFGEASGVGGVNGDQSDDTAAASGAVYVFTREAGPWSQQAYVKASNPGAEDEFGAALALSADGTALAVGATLEASGATGLGGDESDDSVAGAGAAYVFTRAAGVWSQQAYVKAPNTDGNDFFGRSVALSGDGGVLAVGGFQEDSAATGIGGDQSDDSVDGAGAVYVY